MSAHLPKFATVKTWMALSGMSERNTYCRLASGDLRGVKIGRAMVIDVDAGMAWLRSCPPAKIKPPPPDKRRKHAAGAEA